MLEQEGQRRRPLQFSLRGLFLLTTLTAVVATGVFNYPRAAILTLIASIGAGVAYLVEEHERKRKRKSGAPSIGAIKRLIIAIVGCWNGGVIALFFLFPVAWLADVAGFQLDVWRYLAIGAASGLAVAIYYPRLFANYTGPKKLDHDFRS